MSTAENFVEGRWQLIRGEHAGQTMPDMVAEKTVLELLHGTYAVKFGGEAVDTGSYELGGAMGGSTVLLRGTTGPNAGRTIPCIYQVQGDRLRMCYGFDGLAPTDYTSNTSNKRYVGTYRRL